MWYMVNSNCLYTLQSGTYDCGSGCSVYEIRDCFAGWVHGNTIEKDIGRGVEARTKNIQFTRRGEPAAILQITLCLTEQSIITEIESESIMNQILRRFSFDLASKHSNPRYSCSKS